MLNKCVNSFNLLNSQRIIDVMFNEVDKKDWIDILAIIKKESNGDSLAFNGEDYGIMQINKMHFNIIEYPDSLFHLDYNIRWAYNNFYKPYCLVDYKNRFKRYNGSLTYQNNIFLMLEKYNGKTY